MFRQKKIEIAKACYDELKSLASCKHLIRYPDHKEKDGEQDGVVLKGTRKNGLPKTTYAKKVIVATKYTHQVDEFLLMIAAKTCGVLTPRIKLIPAGTNLFYQFSRDLTDLTFADNQGIYFLTLSELASEKKRYKLKEVSSVISDHHAQGININRQSFAIMVVAALVFDFRDLHKDNVGVVISPSENSATFALIDLVGIPGALATIKLGQYQSFADFIKNSEHCKSLRSYLQAETLTDGELDDAIAAINANFKSACEAVKSQVVSRGLDKILAADHVENKITQWSRNLETLTLFNLNPRLFANMR